MQSENKLHMRPFVNNFPDKNPGIWLFIEKNEIWIAKNQR